MRNTNEDDLHCEARTFDPDFVFLDVPYTLYIMQSRSIGLVNATTSSCRCSSAPAAF